MTNRMALDPAAATPSPSNRRFAPPRTLSDGSGRVRTPLRSQRTATPPLPSCNYHLPIANYHLQIRHTDALSLAALGFLLSAISVETGTNAYEQERPCTPLHTLAREKTISRSCLGSSISRFTPHASPKIQLHRQKSNPVKAIPTRSNMHFSLFCPPPRRRFMPVGLRGGGGLWFRAGRGERGGRRGRSG